MIDGSKRQIEHHDLGIAERDRHAGEEQPPRRILRRHSAFIHDRRAVHIFQAR